MRAIIVHRERLLLVNAWKEDENPLMCAPGGGAEAHASLPDNLAREVMEETGLAVTVGAPCLVNEFHDPARDYHQIEVFFRCTLQGSDVLPEGWQDPEAIVTRRQWVTADQLRHTPHKPSSLLQIAFGESDGLSYDPLEPLLT